jgi:hypothetical protein
MIFSSLVKGNWEKGMSIEETSQLIQLILNSVLMVLTCAFVLGGLLVRRSILENRLQIASIEYFQAMHRFGETPPPQLRMLKNQLRYAQQQVKPSQNGILTLYYATILFVLSTFALAIRMAISADWLISLSIALFVAGIVILLLSLAIVLLEFHRADRPFLQEVRDGFANETGVKPSSLKRRNRPVVRVPRRVKVV